MKELAVDLASFIKTRFISGTDFARNKDILGILGEFGDDKVIPVLDTLARAWFSFSPVYLSRTKEFLYATLEGYPRVRIKKIVEQGLNSRNKTIRNISRKLYQ